MLQDLNQYLVPKGQAPNVGGDTSLWTLQDSLCLLQRVWRGAGSCQEQGTALDRLVLSQLGAFPDPKTKVQRW